MGGYWTRIRMMLVYNDLLFQTKIISNFPDFTKLNLGMFFHNPA